MLLMRVANTIFALCRASGQPPSSATRLVTTRTTAYAAFAHAVASSSARLLCGPWGTAVATSPGAAALVSAPCRPKREDTAPSPVQDVRQKSVSPRPRPTCRAGEHSPLVAERGKGKRECPPHRYIKE